MNRLCSKSGGGTAHRTARIFWTLGTVLIAVYFIGALARSGVAFEALAAIPKPYVLALKGCVEALFVAAVFVSARSGNGRKLAVYILIIFIADMALGFGLIPIAGGIFVLAHVYAAFLYNKVPDPSAPRSMRIIGALPVLLTGVTCVYWVSKGTFQIMAIFPIFSALAAFAAMGSTYPKLLLGGGTFVLWISDIVFIIAVISGIDITSVGWLIWLTFATGFAMMVAGLMKGPIEHLSLHSV